MEALTGETPDISEYLDFGFYDLVWYKETAGLGEIQLGRFLDVSHGTGSLMSYWVLPLCTREECAYRYSRDWIYLIQWLELHPRVPRGPVPTEFEPQPFQPKPVTPFWDEGTRQPMRLGANECHCSR